MIIINKKCRYLVTPLGLTLLLFLHACSVMDADRPKSDPQPLPPAVISKPLPKIGLVLGGGAARGFAHIGVLKVLESNGITPDFIVGTSAGSVVGAIYASGMNATELQRNAISLEESALGDWTLSSKGVIRGDALQNMVNRLVNNKTIENMPRRFACTAVELNTGKLVVFERGNTGLAVRASSSVPGVFQPALINNIEFVDGGVVTPVPVRVAKRMGAEFIIAVDISAKPSAMKKSGALDIVLQSVTILGESLAGFETAEADVLIKPKVGMVGSADFNSRNFLILEGEQAAAAAMPEIKRRLAAR
ncbi:MAG: patatin-like phospholipase family protein [Burkholderiales bacterium]|nr:patatin-like phospholipase family protein [Burkholderiales bacterium]